MVRHVIIWTVKASASPEEKIAAKNALESLAGRIDGLVSINVFINPLSSSTADMMLDSVFESEDALLAYSTNPEHVKAASFVRAISTSRACYDYAV